MVKNVPIQDPPKNLVKISVDYKIVELAKVHKMKGCTEKGKLWKLCSFLINHAAGLLFSLLPIVFRMFPKNGTEADHE